MFVRNMVCITRRYGFCIGFSPFDGRHTVSIGYPWFVVPIYFGLALFRFGIYFHPRYKPLRGEFTCLMVGLLRFELRLQGLKDPDANRYTINP